MPTLAVLPENQSITHRARHALATGLLLFALVYFFFNNLHVKWIISQWPGKAPFSPTFGWALFDVLMASPILLLLGEGAWLRFLKKREYRETSFGRLIKGSPSAETDIWFWLYSASSSVLRLGTITYWIASNRWIQAWKLTYFEHALGPWTLAIVSYFATTFIEYWTHWLSHNVPEFWEFHKVHHTAEEMTILNAYREHPLLNVVQDSIRVALLALLGLSMGSIFVVMALRFVHGHLQHSQCRSGWGWLGLAVISPRAHWIHHSADPAHHNRNLGDNIALWDHVFGTYLSGTDVKASGGRFKLGISDDSARYQNVISALLSPFSRSISIFSSRFKAASVKKESK